MKEHLGRSVERASGSFFQRIFKNALETVAPFFPRIFKGTLQTGQEKKTSPLLFEPQGRR
jgi:hypothetical protein